MPTPVHTLDLFQRPKEGSHVLSRFIVLNYQHTIAAQGGFDTMQCDIAVRSQTEGQDFLNNYLGCFVKAFADNPVEPIWEGLINRITFNSGGVSFTIGMDELANRVSITYNDNTNANVQTTVANSTTSQAIYGIKADMLEMGANASGTTSHPNALRDTILAQRAFPQTSITQGGGDTNLVHLECIGIFHTLEWEKEFSSAVATSGAFDVRISAVLSILANGTTFFNNADTSQITANAKLASTQRRNMSTWEYFLKIAEAGNGSNYWICGITPTNWQTGLRVLYYKQVNDAVEYTARQSDGLRVRNLYGRLVEPWTVRPDRTIRVTDVLVGYNSAVSTDPRDTYIFNIQYSANDQKVQWMGADDTTAKGAFMLRRGFKPYGRSFGAALKVQTT